MNIENEIKIKELQQTRAIEHFKSVISMAELALKTSILTNGAAAISSLTFVGNAGEVASKELVVYGLFLFTLGVLFGAVATFFAYLTQNSYMEQINEDIPLNDDGKYKQLAIKTCGASYLFFLVGIVLVGGGILG